MSDLVRIEDKHIWFDGYKVAILTVNRVPATVQARFCKMLESAVEDPKEDEDIFDAGRAQGYDDAISDGVGVCPECGTEMMA